jgi:hypothetical protein
MTATAIPPRPRQAMTGSQFAQQTADMTGVARQRAAVRQLLSGNVPDFLRHLRPVRLGSPSGRTATVWVTPDYLAIGSDRDFLRIPLTEVSAVQVVTRFAGVLPTTRIVDAVWAQSAFHLEPDPLPPGPWMRSTAYYLRHRALIERRRARSGLPLGVLISGHKKDLVLTNRLLERSGRVAIYGWHHRNGEPIQPLSTVHGARYADYSHGVRLVLETVWVNSEPRSIYDILADPDLAPLLSSEGPMEAAWKLMHPGASRGMGTTSSLTP